MPSVNVVARVLVQLVDDVKAGAKSPKDLLVYIDERSDLFADLNEREAARVKGFALAAFGQVGLPEQALAIVLEELESGLDNYTVAAAARALRGYRKPEPEFSSFLLRAIYNFIGHDDCLTFQQFRPRWPIADATSTLTEILESLNWVNPSDAETVNALAELRDSPDLLFPRPLLGRLNEVVQRAIHNQSDTKRAQQRGCCDLRKRLSVQRPRKSTSRIGTIPLEDQNGVTRTFAERFDGRVAVIAFFYTRCSNPQKCSLTITKLAALKRELDSDGLSDDVLVAGVSYDPEYDLPNRLRMFGVDRGFDFSDSGALLRSTDRHDELVDELNLQVNYAGSIVNQHAIELFVLNGEGCVEMSISRLQWDSSEVAEHVRELVARSGNRTTGPLGTVMGALGSVSLLLMPKCPVCWSGYMSLLGISTLEHYVSRSNVLIASIVLLLLYVGLIATRCRDSQQWSPLVVSVLGAVGMLWSVYGALDWPFRASALAMLLLAPYASILTDRLPAFSRICEIGR